MQPENVNTDQNAHTIARMKVAAVVPVRAKVMGPVPQLERERHTRSE